VHSRAWCQRRSQPFWLGWLVLALLLSACGWIPGPAAALPPPTATPRLILAAANATPTATPFQPLPVTPTFLPTGAPTATPTAALIPEASPTASAPAPTLTPELPAPTETPDLSRTWEDYPGPSVWPDVTIPNPTGLLAQPEGQVNILLLGSDQRPNDSGFRTDTIQLLTLTPSQGSVTITSFPRDLYVYIPGYTMQRINTAFARGGFKMLALTMEYNFGVTPDYYVMINLWSFKDVIDSLGGITVNVMNTLTDHRDNYGQFTIYSGAQVMDGETALWYVRSRYSTSDFERGRRQQEVLEGIFRKILSLDGIRRAPQLYELYRKNVETNLAFDNLAKFLPLAAQVAENGKLRRFNISGKEVWNYVNSYGAQVLLPNREAILPLMRQALNTP
jgi:LCP family protein required for cell wall assembly